MMQRHYEFDDVLIKPKISNVLSRDDVDISINIKNKFKINFPLFASPMREIVDVDFLVKLDELGGFGFLHRFYFSNDDRMNDLREYKSKSNKTGMTLSLNDNYYRSILEFEPDIILIDIANGYLTELHRFCEITKNEISKNNYKTLLMAGNVSDYNGTLALKNSGVDIVRVGIGNGSNCSTRNVTGIGIPSISSIQSCSQVDDIFIVADGGIRNSGDFVKAIVAGADAGMAGRLFGETYESPAEGKIYGMASRTHIANMGLNSKSIEGFDTPIDKKHSLEQFIHDFGYGIKSAGTYLNSKSLNEIRINGEFIEVSDFAIKKNIF